MKGCLRIVGIIFLIFIGFGMVMAVIQKTGESLGLVQPKATVIVPVVVTATSDPDVIVASSAKIPPTETSLPANPTVTPSNTSSPTDTRSPTLTHAPTNTPMPSTSTSVPTATPLPTNTPLPTDVPLPIVAEAAEVLSKGIGVTRAQWESVYGEGEYDGFFTNYGDYSALYNEDSIFQVEHNQSDGLAPNVAEAIIASLIPSDAVLIDTYSPDGVPEKTVNVYESAWLGQQFTSDSWVWFGEEPGVFIVSYNSYESGVSRIIVATGNNP